MAQQKVLVVEDTDEVRELIFDILTAEGFEVKAVASGEEALGYLVGSRPDIILLDVGLPGVDGVEVCRKCKADPQLKDIPIIMVTGKVGDEDIVKGLESGADDYITKPFNRAVLVARLKAILRRKAKAPPEAVPQDEKVTRVHGIEINLARHEVTVGGQAVELTLTEFKILHFLASRPGWVFTRGQIVEAIRDANHVVTPRAVDVQIVGLRKKLGASADAIETIRGVGYRLKD